MLIDLLKLDGVVGTITALDRWRERSPGLFGDPEFISCLLTVWSLCPLEQWIPALSVYVVDLRM